MTRKPGTNNTREEVKMASKMDDVSSPALAYKFVAKTFDPEKCNYELIAYIYVCVCLMKVVLTYVPTLADVKDLSSQCDTDAELQEHRKRIQLLSEETALALKKNVYKNYMQFIETSKEISCILLSGLSVASCKT